MKYRIEIHRLLTGKSNLYEVVESAIKNSARKER